MSISPSARKRDHESFSQDDSFSQLFKLETPLHGDTQTWERLEKGESIWTDEHAHDEDDSHSSLPTPPVSVNSGTADSAKQKREASPAQSIVSSADDLTDVGSATPSLRGQSPLPYGTTSAFAALNGSAPPPQKRVKFTFQEKEQKRIEKEIKDRARAEEKARRDVEKQAQAADKERRNAEKAHKSAEKEVERKRKEAEREEKRLAQEAEKAAKEEKRLKKEEERRQKEEEKQKAEEMRRKEQGKQKTLGSFFKIPETARTSSVERTSMSPGPPDLALTTSTSPLPTPSKPKHELPYHKAFSTFFIFSDVKLAPTNRFERDEQASESIQKTLDEYLHQKRSPGKRRPFHAPKLFHLPDNGLITRGKRCMPVREIMAEISGDSIRTIDLTTDSQNTQIKKTTELLRRVPMKFLGFQEDVRPSYRGTYTRRPVNGIEKIARNPIRKDLPYTDYDYDSEAEWADDGDAEDCKSDDEDEADGVDDVEDMDGFLDDEDDVPLSKRMVVQGDLGPVCSGLCWEDRKKRSTNVKMLPYRMETILDRSIKSIDPLSTAYWESASKKTMDPPRVPLNTMKSTASTVNFQPVTSFFQPQDGSSMTQSTTPRSTAPSSSKPRKLIPQEDMEAFKHEVQGNDLSKVGLIEVLKKKFPGRGAAAIKDTLELVAKRVGGKASEKRWVLIGGAGSA